MATRGRGFIVVLLLVVGCGHDWSSADVVDGDALVPSEDGEGFVDVDGTNPEADAADGVDVVDDAAEAREDGTVDAPPSVCGDGLVGPGEECDDGNLDDTDACPSSCRVAQCRDGFVWAGHEECDPGASGVVPGCDSDCTFAACGDGVVGIVPGFADGFEAGVLSEPPWENGSPYGFTSTTSYAYDGGNSLVSTNRGIRDSRAWVQLRAATDGEVCFWFMGESADRGDDEFRFLVDGSEEFSEDVSQLSWLQVCESVPPGVHTFRWEYDRENRATSSGLDAYYIDGVDTGGPFAEECDDGNPENTDDCLDSCRAATCGDGYVRAGVEECDGRGRSCTTSCGSTGTDACSATCRWSGTCTPPTERCNGVDDDCDGSADEGYTCRQGTSRSCTNACGVAGTQTCGIVCTWGTCCASAEVCQCGTLCDDDCDGLTDEGCVPC